MKIHRLYIVIGIIALYVFVFTLLTFLKFNTMHSTSNDLAIFVRGLWGIQHNAYEIYSVKGETLWELYFAPILYPLTWFSSWKYFPQSLLLIQSFCIGVASYYLYLYAIYKNCSFRFSIVLMVAFLLHPAVQNANLFEFHTTVLALPFVVAFLYFAEQKKIYLATAFLLGGVICREEITGIFWVWGVILFLQKKELKLSIGIVVFSLVWIATSLYFKLQQPAITNVLLSSIATHIPGVNLYGLGWLKFKTLFILLAGFSFFSIFGLKGFLLGIIPFGYYFFSPNQKFFTLAFHYTAILVPFFSISAANAYPILLKKINDNFICAFLISCAIACNFYSGFSPWCLKGSMEEFSEDNYSKEAKEILSRISPDTVLIAPYRISAHVAQRKWLLAGIMAGPDELILEKKRGRGFSESPEEYKNIQKLREAAVADLQKQFLYKICYEGKELILLKKTC